MTDSPRPAAPPAADRPSNSAGAPVGRARAWASFTIADGLMLLIGGLAAWLRLGDLAGLPLSPAEATAALANRQFWSAAPLDVPVSSPAYFAFTHLVMSLGGSSDTAARLVPAVFGVLTVLLVWAWRGRAGPLARRRPGRLGPRRKSCRCRATRPPIFPCIPMAGKSFCRRRENRSARASSTAC